MRNWRWAVVTAAVLVGLTIWGSQALAGTPGTVAGNGDFVGGVTFPGPEPLVLWNLPGSGGRLGTCIQASANGPLTGPYTRQDSITDPVYAELNHLFANGATSDVRLAELSALNSLKYDVVNKQEQWSYVVNGQGGLSVADANAMLAEAKALAGPYSVSVSWPASATAVDTAYTATVTVRSAAGVGVPGLPVSLSGTNVSLSSSSTTTNASGVATVGFRIPAGTSPTATIAASVPQWTTLDRYVSSGEQAMLVTGGSSTARGTHTAPVNRTRDVTLVKVAAGDTAQTPVPGYTFRITAADGTVIYPTITSGTAPVALGALTAGQTYRASEITAPAGGQLYIPENPTTTFTVPVGTGQWTLVVADPVMPSPALQTRATPARAIVGQRLDDHVTISGNDGEHGTITAHLYGPVDAPSTGACADLSLSDYEAAPSQVFTASVDAAANGGNGDVVVEGPVITKPGCYGWAEQLRLTPSGASTESPPTAPNESSLVTAPAVGTVVSAQVALPGSTLHDTVTITGLNGQTATLTASLYGPLPANPSTGCAGYGDDAWRAAVRDRGDRLLVAQTSEQVTGDGERVVAPATPSRLGCYTYVEDLVPDTTGAAGAVHTAFGQRAESTLLIAPSVHTTATAAAATVGDALRDVVEVDGLAGTEAMVSGVLLGPVAPIRGTCAGVSWERAPVAGVLARLAVRGDGRYVTAPLRAMGAGCYTFVETLTGPGGITLAATAPGERAETVLVSRVIPLALTGVSTGAWLRVGAVLSVLGATLLVFGRPRRRPVSNRA